jgi:hypothetical protein
MAEKLSIEEVLARLEQSAALHRERQRFHAAQEAQHREQKEVHDAELAKVLASLEAFRNVALPAQELAAHAAPPSQQRAPEVQVKLAESGRLLISRTVRAVVETWTGSEPFGAADVAAEVNRRAQGRLRRPVEARGVSDALRRLVAEGSLQLVRPGGPYHGAVYSRLRQIS